MIKFSFLLFSCFCFLSFGQINDLKLDSIFHRSNVGEFYANGLEYFQLPASQLRPIECSALVSNIGENDLTNCYLQVEVILDGLTFITVFSDSVFIPIGSQDSIYLNTSINLTGEPIGLYTFKYTMFSDSLEADYMNNSASFNFGITNHILSRSDFAIQDSSKHYYSDSLEIYSFGYVFQVENETCLNAIYPWMSNDPLNSQILYLLDATLFVLDTLAENNFSPIAVTESDYVPTEDLGGPTEIKFGPFDNVLEAGKTYLITINSLSKIHDFYLSQETIDSTVFRALTDGTPGSAHLDKEPLSNMRMIKMDLEFETGYYCSASLDEQKLSNLKIYPNPATDFVTLEYDLTKNSLIQLIDINGRLIREFEATNTATNLLTLNLENVKIGTYFIRITTENESISMQLFIY